MSTTRLPELPELPEPPEHDEVITNNYGSGHTDEQLQQYARAYGLAVWKAAMEAAFDACQREEEMARNAMNWQAVYATVQCCDAIRALPLPEQGGPQ